MFKRRITLVTAALLLSAIGAWANNGDVPAEGLMPEHKVVLTEVGGGTDSSASPDGKYIAFSSRRSGNMDVWTVEVETGALRQITTHPDTDNEPRWHPDGTHLVFVTHRNGSQDVYTVDLKTLEEKPIATEDFNEDYPSFSKDGSEICFTGGPRGFREVQIYNYASGETRTITRGYGYVGSSNFSPDGKYIVFHAYFDNSYMSGKSDVFIVPSQGGEVVNITNDRDNWDYKPNWSYCGEWITFSAKRDTENFNIYVMRKDGSDLHAVTRVVGPDLRWSNWTKDGRIGWHQINAQQGRLRALDVASGAIQDLMTSEFNVTDLAPSPDGKQLLFETDARVIVMDAAPGAEQKEIGNGLAPRWNVSGDSVSMLINWRQRVAVVPSTGGDARVIDAAPAEWPQAASTGWSPDGKTLALITEADEGLALTLVGEDGESKMAHQSVERLSAPVWSADGKYVFFAENTPPSVSYCISTERVDNAG